MIELYGVLRQQVAADPFNVVATLVFVAAIVHTFVAARIAALAHAAPAGSVRAEILHFFGEIEVIFGLWAVPLLLIMSGMHGWERAKHYVNDSVSYTEALFVVVIMALASTRPVLGLAESGLQLIAGLAGGTPRAWWTTILIAGPLLGSFITEPAAMTICALLLSRQFYACGPSVRLKYATLGLLFVNVSIGGTLTHFAAPPVLMVAEPWGWSTPFMLRHFGLPAIAAIIVSTFAYRIAFRRDLQALNLLQPPAAVEQPDEEAGAVLLPVPAWVTWSTSPSWPGRSPTRTTRCSSLAASCSSWDSRARRRITSHASICACRCWSGSSWPASSFTADCRAGGSRRCSHG